jgi:hypothetical protein
MNSHHFQGKNSGMTAMAITMLAAVIMSAGAAVPA